MQALTVGLLQRPVGGTVLWLARCLCWPCPALLAGTLKMAGTITLLQILAARWVLPYRPCILPCVPSALLSSRVRILYVRSGAPALAALLYPLWLLLPLLLVLLPLGTAFDLSCVLPLLFGADTPGTGGSNGCLCCDAYV